jgi:hypothetical protein
MSKKNIINILNQLVKTEGGARKLSKKTKISEVLISRWRHGGTIGPKGVIILNRIYGIDPFSLRPDIFPKNIKITYT